MDLELRDRIAVITGCSVGIGQEIARVLATEGAETIVVARRKQLLETLQKEVQATGGPQPYPIAVDLADRGYLVRV